MYLDSLFRGESIVKERYYGVSVGYAGTMFWVVHRVYKSACHVDLSNYPYDSHTCDLWFQSLVNPTADLDPVVYGPSPPFDLSTYLGSYELTGTLRDISLTKIISFSPFKRRVTPLHTS